jgi:hypothetical protein
MDLDMAMATIDDIWSHQQSEVVHKRFGWTFAF